MDISGIKLNGKIAAFVSGGVDSMVMLDLLMRGGTDLFVVHVNHGIREEADSDCAFVEDYCHKLNIPFEKYHFDIPMMAKNSGRSIETEARLTRREVIDGILVGGRADKAALAHHADDNAETVLMHILRGSGIDGLKGIEQSNKVVRPLLAFTREQISDYAKTHRIPYVEDKTNSDSKYTRNFIRLEVMPLIKSRYPAATEALNRLALNAATAVNAIDSQLDLSFINESDSEVRMSLKAFDSPLAWRYVIISAKRLMPVDISEAHINNVLKLAKSSAGSVAELAGGLKAYKDYDCITFCFEDEFADFSVPFVPGTIELISDVITIKQVSPQPIKGKTVIAAPPNGCIFRRRREGDIFVPYGGRRKSLKKYLIDKKIPKRKRDRLVCLCNGNEVLAIIGLEISDKVKITEKTETAYLIEHKEKKFE